MRDAIVISGWKWETCNVPERMAMALAHGGSRVLYCENPVSFCRHDGRGLAEVDKEIYAFGPAFLGHRLNVLPLLPQIQAKYLAYQILRNASKLKLRDPFFIYPHGDYCLTLGREFKRLGFPLIHICMDYHVAEQLEHVKLSDLTLAIPRAAFEELKEQFGGKIRLLPQFASLDCCEPFRERSVSEPPELSKIPRPRLGYLGPLEGRISFALIGELLSKYPQWHFLSFGIKKSLSLPNEHVLSWRSQNELSFILDGLDVGFLPYDCSHPKNLHCVPLKLFDYFARGMPVVATPIVYLQDYADIVYVGSTVKQIAEAISEALNEPINSPKKAKRMAMAREHSIENQSRFLASALGQMTPTCSGDGLHST